MNCDIFPEINGCQITRNTNVLMYLYQSRQCTNIFTHNSNKISFLTDIGNYFHIDDDMAATGVAVPHHHFIGFKLQNTNYI